MRQRSAPFGNTGDQHSDRAWHAQQPSRSQPRPLSMTSRLSLPQRPAIVDSTLADPPSEDTLRHTVEGQPIEARPVPEVPALSTVTAPLDLQEALSDSGLHLIPRAHPAIRHTRFWQSWHHSSSPRMTILKLSLIGIVLFSVLGATLATAGSGGVTQLLFSALGNSAPYNPLAPSSATPITRLVQPILQADINAGYDSPQQHDLFWNAACSAAVMTEILRAWGVSNITIGRIIDEMTAHQPPYITPWGGLMSQNGWNYIAGLHGFRAKVQLNRSMSYNEIVRTTELQGIPVVLGLRDSAGRYYPAFGGGGHFLIAVGGNAAGLRIVDSSLYRITELTRDQFDYLWTGETVIITPA